MNITQYRNTQETVSTDSVVLHKTCKIHNMDD